jgi:cytochrome c oxidase subunit 4
MSQTHSNDKIWYYIIFAALLVLTGTTVAVAYVDLGALNGAVAVTIATFKAFLVMAFFMHLRHSDRLTWLYAGVAVLWVIMMIVGFLSDYIAQQGLLLAKG